MLGFLRRHCSKGVSCDIQKTLYISLVRSHLIYASQVWSPCFRGSIYLMRSLEKVQRRATCFILCGFELDYKCRLIQLKLFPLCYFLEYLDLLFLFYCINGEIRFDISRFVQFSHSKTRCGTSGMVLRLNFARISTFRESFLIRICPMWNVLPLDIHTSEHTSVFKSRLKKLLFARLQSTFDSENTRTWYIICPICRSPNVDAACSC
jgi:hypothetical protein